MFAQAGKHKCRSSPCVLGISTLPGQEAPPPPAAPLALPAAVVPPVPPVTVPLAPPPDTKPKPEIFTEELHAGTLLKNVKLCWVKTIPKPRGTIILANQIGDPVKALLSGYWVEYASKMGFGLMALGFSENKPGSDAEEALTLLEKFIYSTAEKIYGTGKGLVAISSDRGTYWTQQLILRQPDRWGFWVARYSKDFPQVSSKAIMPKGILFASTPEEQAATQKHFEALRRGSPHNRIMLANCARKRFDTGVVTQFWQATLESLLSNPTEAGFWHDVKSLRSVAPAIAFNPHQLSLLPPMETLCWMPNREIAAMWRLLCSDPATGQVTSPPASPPAGAGANAVPPPADSTVPPEPKIWKLTFKPTPEFSATDFHWVVQHEKCKAVLLFVDGGTAVNWVLKDPGWRQFAQDNQVNLAVLTLRTSHINEHGSAAAFLARRVLAFVDDEFGKRVPLLVHTEGPEASYWMHFAMRFQPQRVLAWGAVSGVRFPAVGPKLSVPPGFLLPVPEKGRSFNFQYFEELRNSDPANRVALIVGNPQATDRAQTSEFSREYFAAVLKGDPKEPTWRNFNDWSPPPLIKRPGEIERTADYGWFPSPEVVGMWKLIQKEAGKAALIEPLSLPWIAKRTFPTDLKEMPQLNLFIRIPGKLLDGGEIKGVYCFSTWEKEDSTLMNKLKSQDDAAVKFAERNDLAMVTWNTSKLFPGGSLQGMNAEQMAIFEARMRQVTLVWDKAIKKLASEFGFPDSGYLLHGFSQGANLGHQMPLFLPSRFLAAHMHVTNRFIPPKPAAHETLWLITTGELDGGYTESWQFYQKGSAMNYPMLIKAGANLGHTGRSDITSLGFAFFDYALNLHKQTLAEQDQVQFSPKKQEVPTAAQRMRNDLTKAPFFGDFINHETFPMSEAEQSWVPEPQRIAIPTEELAKQWGKQPQELVAIVPPQAAPTVPVQPAAPPRVQPRN